MKEYKMNFYKDLYKKISDMSLSDAEELAENSKTEDERFFFETVTNFLMQREQIKLIRNNIF